MSNMPKLEGQMDIFLHMSHLFGMHNLLQMSIMTILVKNLIKVSGTKADKV
jgi:hypothetical protein